MCHQTNAQTSDADPPRHFAFFLPFLFDDGPLESALDPELDVCSGGSTTLPAEAALEGPAPPVFWNVDKTE